MISSTRTSTLSVMMAYVNEMWPYYYQNRSYGNQTLSFLKFIGDLENSKWSIGGIDKLFGISYRNFTSSDYEGYSNPTFLKREQKTSVFIDGLF